MRNISDDRLISIIIGNRSRTIRQALLTVTDNHGNHFLEMAFHLLSTRYQAELGSPAPSTNRKLQHIHGIWSGILQTMKAGLQDFPTLECSPLSSPASLIPSAPLRPTLATSVPPCPLLSLYQLIAQLPASQMWWLSLELTCFASFYLNEWPLDLLLS